MSSQNKQGVCLMGVVFIFYLFIYSIIFLFIRPANGLDRWKWHRFYPEIKLREPLPNQNWKSVWKNLLRQNDCSEESMID